VLRLGGENLAGTKTVIFLGGSGSRDDRRAPAKAASQHRVLVAIPTAARSGKLRVVGPTAATVGPRLQVLPVAVPAPPLPGAGVFPVQGTHDYGTATNAFGGGREHQGQDILAACGTPVVAALGGEVTLTRFQERAGNYVVIKADDGTSQAYMHLLEPATVTQGDRVTAGQALGQVGQTGRTTACHLHFELWTAPGWYEGGVAIDPLPLLKVWDTPS
jgi:murein DD-endopeptidase MepM/ murein hydrolase activator NlpD